MKEHFQLFSGPMVVAILGGFKDMTRRLVTPENSLIDGMSARTREGKALWRKLHWPSAMCADSRWLVREKRKVRGKAVVHRIDPYVRMGDVLIGKETFARVPTTGFDVIAYRATAGNVLTSGVKKWQPSIFMPKSLSRLRLEVVATMPQRLQDIPAGDVPREGLKKSPPAGYPSAPALWAWPGYNGGSSSPIYAYELLWDMLNEEEGTRWDDNPPVWVRVFKRI